MCEAVVKKIFTEKCTELTLGAWKDLWLPLLLIRVLFAL